MWGKLHRVELRIFTGELQSGELITGDAFNQLQCLETFVCVLVVVALVSLVF